METTSTLELTTRQNVRAVEKKRLCYFSKNNHGSLTFMLQIILSQFFLLAPNVSQAKRLGREACRKALEIAWAPGSWHWPINTSAILSLEGKNNSGSWRKAAIPIMIHNSWPRPKPIETCTSKRRKGVIENKAGRQLVLEFWLLLGKVLLEVGLPLVDYLVNLMVLF